MGEFKLFTKLFVLATKDKHIVNDPQLKEVIGTGIENLHVLLRIIRRSMQNP